MVKGIKHAAAGMISRMRQQEAISNNLANVNTTGYKANRVIFSHEINSAMLRNSYPTRPGQGGGDYYFLNMDLTQGALQDTRNPLDVAIGGSGFLVIESGESFGYTRNGNFSLNEENELINGQGHRVQGVDGAIRITGSDVVIRESGEVVVDGRVAGRIRVVDFPSDTQLKRNADGYFIPEGEIEPVTSENSRIMQGKLEKSNVNPVRAMVQMIELNRNFEALQKAIHAQNETLRIATNEIVK